MCRVNQDSTLCLAKGRLPWVSTSRQLANGSNYVMQMCDCNANDAVHTFRLTQPTLAQMRLSHQSRAPKRDSRPLPIHNPVTLPIILISYLQMIPRGLLYPMHSRTCFSKVATAAELNFSLARPNGSCEAVELSFTPEHSSIGVHHYIF